MEILASLNFRRFYTVWHNARVRFCEESLKSSNCIVEHLNNSRLVVIQFVVLCVCVLVLSIFSLFSV